MAGSFKIVVTSTYKAFGCFTGILGGTFGSHDGRWGRMICGRGFTNEGVVDIPLKISGVTIEWPENTAWLRQGVTIPGLPGILLEESI